jgi:hypothetical protein
MRRQVLLSTQAHTEALLHQRGRRIRWDNGSYNHKEVSARTLDRKGETHLYTSSPQLPNLKQPPHIPFGRGGRGGRASCVVVVCRRPKKLCQFESRLHGPNTRVAWQHAVRRMLLMDRRGERHWRPLMEWEVAGAGRRGGRRRCRHGDVVLVGPHTHEYRIIGSGSEPVPNAFGGSHPWLNPERNQRFGSDEVLNPELNFGSVHQVLGSNFGSEPDWGNAR